MPNQWTTGMLLALATAIAAVGSAHGEVLVSDRPNATESSSIVDAGRIQLEAGYRLAREEDLDLRRHEGGAMLFRLGLHERIELRFGIGGYISERATGGIDDEGLGDAVVGFKLKLLDEGGLVPQTAVLAHASLPIGDEAFSSNRVDPKLRRALSHTISQRVGAGYNFGVEMASSRNEAGEDVTLSSGIYTLSLSAGLVGRLSAFIEVFGDVGLSADDDHHSVDTGLTLATGDDFQFDMLGGLGLNEEAEDWFVGVGFSYRVVKSDPEDSPGRGTRRTPTGHS